MASLGLHLTKCAGTSLISTLRRILTEDEYLLLSSLYENVLANRPFAWEIEDFAHLRLIYGHYLHESILTLLRPRDCWDFYLFTGVRDPVNRSYSQYKHLERVQGSAPNVDEFINLYGSSMCDEIIRAFPSLVDSEKPKWLNAAKILTCFDYIFSTEDYDRTILPVIASLEVPLQQYQTCSVTDNVNHLSRDPDLYDKLAALLGEGDDTILYSLINNAIGVENAGFIIASNAGIPRQREELFMLQLHSPAKVALDQLFGLHSNMLGYELHLLGDDLKSKALARLQGRASRLTELCDFLGSRTY